MNEPEPFGEVAAYYAEAEYGEEKNFPTEISLMVTIIRSLDVLNGTAARLEGIATEYLNHISAK